MHFCKFLSINVSSATLSQAENAFSFEKIRAIPFFGTDGLFTTPTEEILRSYPDAFSRFYAATRAEFRENYCKSVLGAGKEKEHERELRVLKELIGPLCGGKCLVSKHGKPRCTTEQYTGVFEIADLGIGNDNTWHGFLDAMAKPGDSSSEVALSLSNMFLSDSSSTEPSTEPSSPSLDSSDGEEGSAGEMSASSPSSQSSAGDGVGIEFKRKVTKTCISQAAAEAIVCSFVHHSRHKHQSPLVPILLLDGKSFYIVMYDCVDDVLLISDEVTIVKRRRALRSRILLLWMILHYQVILKETTQHYKDLLTDPEGALRSRFHQKCKDDKWLHHYKSLQDYNQPSIPKKQ